METAITKRPVGRPRKDSTNLPAVNISKQQSSIVGEPHRKEPGAINPIFVMDEVLKLQMFQIRVDLNRWITAINQAESTLLPDRTELMQVYKDIKLDAHLTGVMNAIKNKIKSKEFQLVDQSGNTDDDACEAIFEQQWFFDWIDYVVESLWEGYSLMQLGPIKNNTFIYIELVPREYVVPEWNLVKHTLYITTKEGGTNFLDDKKFARWLIMIDNHDLGILNKCVPHMIGKKNVNMYWWQFSELFGIPFRKGKTDIRDEKRRRNMERMLSNMGSAGWGVFNEGDDVEFISSQHTDAYQIFKEAIELANKEVSKLLAGQTMMFDQGSSRSQGEVHQDLFYDILTSILRKIKFLTNSVLIPKMISLGIQNLDGKHFRYEFEDEVKWQDKVKMVHDLGQVGYKFDEDFIDEYLDLGAEGRIKLVQSMPSGLAGVKDNEDAIKNILDMPTYAYLHKLDELKKSYPSQMAKYKSFYNSK